VWIPNGVDLSLFSNCKTATETSDRVFSLMYFGAHGQANGLDNILYAMQKINDLGLSKKLTFRMIGNGPLKPSLIELAQKTLKLPNVSFEASVPKNQIPGLASEADAFIFNLIDIPVFKFGISSNKLFDFMAADRPTICCCESSNNPIAEADAGITVPPGNPDQLAQAILYLMQLPHNERIQMGRRGRLYIEKNHNFELLAKRLATTLDESVKEYFK
jgi:glycosyltransferase involved in cell wall biosynthesis